MKCCYCSEPLGQPHKYDCIYKLGKSLNVEQLVTESQCNRELKHVKPLDTSTLKPIKVDHDFTAARAKLVRQAIDAIRHESPQCGEFWYSILVTENDELLAKLGRMLRL